MSVEPLQLAETIANGGAAVLALPLALRSRDHRPVAMLLAYGVASAVVHERLRSAVGDARPIVESVALRALHVDQVRLLAWHFGAAAVAAITWSWRHAVLVIAGVAPVVIVAAVLGPVSRAAHDRAYIVASALSVAVLAWCVVRRNGGPWSAAKWALVCVGAGELVALLTYVRNPWDGAAWSPAQAGYLVAFGAATAVQARALWAARDGGSRR